ncbi:hypothetical protein ABC337_09270 [Arthrobacter sp. 1P04PC]
MVSIVISILVFAVPAAVITFALYWIIRMGVKHGLRSYYAERQQQSETSI